MQGAQRRPSCRPLLVLVPILLGHSAWAQTAANHANTTTPALRGAAQDASGRREFVNPEVGGHRLSYCLDEKQTACGLKAADAFCKSPNVSCARALAYGGLPDYKDSIYLLGDNKVKGPSKADVFDRIVCDCSKDSAPVHRSLMPLDFGNPTFRGYRIAHCLDDAKSGCGQEAADRFCKAQTPSCGHASSFNVVPAFGGPTFQQGDGRVKSPGTNDAFDRITCECESIAARFDYPKVNGMPLDFCLKKAGEDGGTECGEPPATAFCKSQGFQRAVRYLIDPDAGKKDPNTPTWFIGDQATHTAPGRTAFTVVDCGY